MKDTEGSEALHKDNCQKQEAHLQKEALCYEQEGYQVRIHFSENKTLAQCIKNLVRGSSMYRAGIYCRVSKEDRSSIDSQVNILKQNANNTAAQVATVYGYQFLFFKSLKSK